MPRPSIPDRDELATAMRATAIMEHVPEASVTALAARGAVRVIERNTYLVHQGDPSPDVFFLLKGRVDITSVSTTGQRQLHATLEPPVFFGELGVLGDMPRTSTAIVSEDAVIWTLDGEAFERFVAEEPGAARSLLRSLARQIQEHEALIDDLLFLDLKGRVAKRLLGLAAAGEELPPDGAEVAAPLTHADLAGLSGGSRENVTRILSEFQRRGFVSRNGKRYVLRDVKALAKLAGL